MRRHDWFMTQHSFFFLFLLFLFNRQCYRSVWPMRKKLRILWHQLLFASESFTWITSGNPSGRPHRWLIRIFFASPYRSDCESYGRPALAFCLEALNWYSSIFLCREPLGIYFSPSAFVILRIASGVKYRSDHVKQLKKKKYRESGDVYEIKQNKTKKVLLSFDATFINKHAGRNKEEVETWCKTGCSCLCRVSRKAGSLTLRHWPGNFSCSFQIEPNCVSEQRDMKPNNTIWCFIPTRNHRQFVPLSEQEGGFMVFRQQRKMYW